MKLPFVTRRYHEQIVGELRGEIADLEYVLRGYKQGLSGPGAWLGHLILGVVYRNLDRNRVVELSPHTREEYLAVSVET